MGEGTNLGTAVGYIEIRDNVNAATDGAQAAFDGAIRTMSQKMQGFGDQMSKLGGSILLLSAPLIGFGVQATKASIEFESAFANVKKTVDGSEDDLKKLEGQLRAMALSEGPIGSMEDALLSMTKIAEKAGSLGVPLDKIAGFAQTVALLAGASDDLDPEQAATFIGQFRNVTNMSFDEVDKLVDTVVTLGSKMATTEGQLSTFALRLAPLANYKWDEKDILAYSSALASLGVSPELGGSNLLKSVMDMNVAVATGGPHLQKFAEAAGLTADEFADLANADPQGAFKAFIDGLAKMDASEQILLLKELGITSNEQITTLQRLAGGQQTLNDALMIAEGAWRGNGAALAEAQAKADTTQGTLNKVNNHLMEMKINLGSALTDGLANFAESLIPVIDNISRWAAENPQAVQTIAAMTLAIGALGLGLVVVGQVISAAALIFGGLATAVGLVSLPVWTLIAAIALLVTTAINLLPGIVKSWGDAFKEIGKFIEIVIGKVEDLIAAIGRIVMPSFSGWDFVLNPTGANTRGTRAEELANAPVPTEGPLQRPIPGFASGGYTGDGPANQIKGVVHANEWVFNRRQMAGLMGGRKIADNINVYANSRADGYAAAAAFEDEMEYALRAQR